MRAAMGGVFHAWLVRWPPTGLQTALGSIDDERMRVSRMAASSLVAVLGCSSFSSSSPADAGSDAPAAKVAVHCGTIPPCGDATPECCVSPTTTPTCTAPNTCSQAIIYRCDDRSDCEALGFPGTQCCGHFRDGLKPGVQLVITNSHCAETCDSNNNEAPLCDYALPGSCTSGTCTQAGVNPSNYAYCK